MKISTTNIDQNFSNANRTYKYRSTPQKDMFRLSFMDTKSNKKVEINIDSELLEKLYTKFKDDTTISGNKVNPKGELKNYLEVMWQKFKNEYNYKDSNHNNKLDIEEFLKAKSSIVLENLVKAKGSPEATYSSIEEDYKNGKIAKQAFNDIKKFFSTQMDIITFDTAFTRFINDDINLDANITNDELIKQIGKDNLGKQLLEEAKISSGINIHDAIVRAIKAILEKKKEEIENNIVPLPQQREIKELQKTLQNLSEKERVEFEKDPLAFILRRFELDENIINKEKS